MCVTPKVPIRVGKLSSIIGFATLCCAIAVLQHPWARHHRYAGKTVTEWLAGLNSGNGPAEQRSVAAFASMGSNAVPELVSAITRSDSPLKRTINRLLGPKVSARFGLASHEGEHWRAVRTFWLLGEQVASGIPELVKALNSGHDPTIAARALAGIGPRGLEALAQFTTNRDLRIRLAVAETLASYPWDVQSSRIEFQQASAHFGLACRIAIPLLADFTRDSAPDVRSAAARGLGTFPAEGVFGLPALAALLKDAEPGPREEALKALGLLGPQAKLVVPELLTYIQHAENARDRGLAVVTLWHIDPDAATQTGYSVHVSP